MEVSILELIMILSLIIVVLITSIVSTIVIIRYLKKGSIIIEEQIESNSDIDSIKYFVILKNSRKKQVIIKDFGVEVKPYKVPLLKSQFPLLEHGNLEILAKDNVKVDLSYLVNSKIIDELSGKIKLYYEDAFSEKYYFKSKLLKKFIKIKREKDKNNTI